MDERKRKLEEIRRRASSKSNVQLESAAAVGDKAQSEPVKSIKFRNYKPYDSSLITKVAEFDKNPKEENKSIIVTDIIKEELSNMNKDDELNIVPKKLNWDLKSQVSSKIARLEKRTQRAIVEILREKLTTEAANETDNELE
mmetsp:Transcript_22752/g.31187  ORF Transcript_22752/g.31187 Transcript_22752/m.31187 type:complete len:142 (+) Transcript_22752:24-449(+)